MLKIYRQFPDTEIDIRFGDDNSELLYADRPFVYIIAKEDLNLFVGSVADPIAE